MVVINIHNNLAIMVISGVKALAARPGDGVRIRKGINRAVQEYALLHTFRIVQIVPSPNLVCYKVTKAQLGIVK